MVQNFHKSRLWLTTDLELFRRVVGLMANNAESYGKEVWI